MVIVIDLRITEHELWEIMLLTVTQAIIAIVIAVVKSVGERGETAYCRYEVTH